MAVEQKGGEALIEDDYQYVNTLDHGTVLPWATAESWARACECALGITQSERRVEKESELDAKGTQVESSKNWRTTHMYILLTRLFFPILLEF